MTKIYIVTASTNYEGFENVKAFVSEADAEAFRDQCNAYNETPPKAPKDIDDTPSNDADWAAWNKAEDAWRVAHPAGEYGATWYEYDMQELEVVGASSNEPDQTITEEAAMRTAHAIVENLHESKAFFDSIDDEIMCEIVDAIAMTIITELQGRV